MQTLPDSPHHLAIWLHENLMDVEPIGNGGYQGVLPERYDFKLIEEKIDDVSERLSGIHNSSTRRIEFYSTSEHVYKDLNEAISQNLSKVPDLFTVLSLNCTYEKTSDSCKSESILQYINAVKLYQLLTQLADHTSENNTVLHFINGHNAKIEITLSYCANDLTPLSGLDIFDTDYVNSTHHEDQKRNIIRIALLDLFKGRQKIPFSEILRKFNELIIAVRSSYAMYMAEFSFEKIRDEVEKDNLDSTLKLNKTFSEIQNQLLALPVALILVGGQMQRSMGLSLKNLVVWLGSLVFSVLMLLLISNQRSAIQSIGREIKLRQDKIKSLPSDIANKFETGFVELDKRKTTQKRLLDIVTIILLLSLLFSTFILLWHSYNDFTRTVLSYLQEQFEIIFRFFSNALAPNHP